MLDGASIYYDQGFEYQKSHQYDKAIEAFTKAIQVRPNYADAYCQRGLNYWEKGEHDKSIQDYNTAINLNPLKDIFYYNRGLAYKNKNENDNAIEDFNEAIRISPDMKEAFNVRAIVYANEKKYDEALEDFNNALNIDPYFVPALYSRGLTYSFIHENSKALEDFDKVIMIDVNYFDAYLSRGNIYFNQGEYEKAINDYSECLELKPSSISALTNRGITYGTKGDLDKALDDFSNIIRLKHDSIDALIGRGTTYRLKKEFDKALTDLKQAEQYKPDYANIFYEQGNVYSEIGNHNKSLEKFSKALELKPDYFEALNNRGHIYFIKEKYDTAKNDFESALKIKKDEPLLYNNYAEVLVEIKEYKAAFKNSCKAVEMNPGDIRLKNVLLNIIDKIITETSIDMFWDYDWKKLSIIPHFFIQLIADFKRNGLTSEKHRKLLNSVVSFWKGRRVSQNKDEYIFQYTTQNVLDSMIENRKLRLTPASYLNDPEEGKIFFDKLQLCLKKDAKNIKENINRIEQKPSNEFTAFVRSFTSLEDKLVMWNSSYAIEGMGVSVGISQKKINRGQNIGITESYQQIYAKLKSSEEFLANIEPKKEVFVNNNQNKDILLEKTGLYKILYVDGDHEDIKKIADCLREFNDRDFTPELEELVSRLFIPIAHLVKDMSYEHEDEYRLLYIGSIKTDKHYIHGDFSHGIYIETEPFLFKIDNKTGKKDLIYLGPKLDETAFQKAKHLEKLKGPDFVADIKQSSIHYR